MKKLLFVPLVLLAVTSHARDWSETVAEPAPTDTVMINNAAQPEGSTSQFTAFEHFPVSDPTTAAIAIVQGDVDTNTTAIGTKGQVNSVVAGANVTVDNTDPANPIVSATGGGSGSLPDGNTDGDIIRWNGSTWLPEAPVVLPISSYNSNPIEFHFSATQLAGESAPGENMNYRVPYDIAYTSVYFDCAGAIDGAVVTIGNASTRYGVYTPSGTINTTGLTDISSWGSLVSNSYIGAWVSTATGTASQCDIQIILTTE